MIVAEPEVCKCAALMMPDGEVLKGKRHRDCFTVALSLGYKLSGSVQGFVTSMGRFVTREEGRRLQDAAGIPSAAPDGYRDRTLFSEDLY